MKLQVDKPLNKLNLSSCIHEFIESVQEFRETYRLDGTVPCQRNGEVASIEAPYRSGKEVQFFVLDKLGSLSSMKELGALQIRFLESDGCPVWPVFQSLWGDFRSSR